APAAAGPALDLSRHENAKLWQDFTDFRYYRLDVTGVYFVGGFGVMGWIAAEDYESARPDPLMDDAARLGRFPASEQLLLSRLVWEGSVQRVPTGHIARAPFHSGYRKGVMTETVGARCPSDSDSE